MICPSCNCDPCQHECAPRVCPKCGQEFCACTFGVPIEKLAFVARRGDSPLESESDRGDPTPTAPDPIEPLNFKGVDPTKIAQHLSNSVEYYTPSNIVEVCRRTMGEIYLDPASCEIANTVVKAKHFYTKQDDGLAKPWAGKVFCNPPGGKVKPNKSQAQLFFFKAVDEFEAGRATAVCFLGFTLEILRLTQARPPSACDFAFCVLRERTDFLNEELKAQGSPTHANCLILISRDKAMIRKFYTEAQVLGAVVVNADLVM